MNKKSQGLSINVIIIVAIALIVLVVLVAIFTGRLGSFNTAVDASSRNCATQCIAAGKGGVYTGTGSGVELPGSLDANDATCECVK